MVYPLILASTAGVAILVMLTFVLPKFAAIFDDLGSAMPASTRFVMGISDFLLWECAYAELVFTDTFWPDFDVQALDAALGEFARRDRRFEIGRAHV